MRSRIIALTALIIVPLLAAPPEEEWIIFIHGTLGLRQNFQLRTFITLFKNDISNTHYQRTVQTVRNDPFLFHNQPMQECGLHEVKVSQHPKTGAALFSKFFDTMYQAYPHSQKHTKRTYFTFGWSGLVSSKARLDDAGAFYKALREKIKKRPPHMPLPTITIIGYSHGGNVALNLAHCRRYEFPNDTFLINTLILVGTPVQKETDYLICDPLFQNIFHIYSRADRIQKLDCFSFKRFFSNRRFRSGKRYTVPPHVTQIEVQLKEKNYNHRWRDRSPGHIELWFFGWPEHKKSFYRPHFPLHPLPIAIFIPRLIDLVKTQTNESHVIVELYPEIDKAAIRPRHHCIKTWVDFIPYKHILQFKKEAENFKPPFSKQLYDQHISSAEKIANFDYTKRSKRSKKRTLCGS